MELINRIKGSSGDAIIALLTDDAVDADADAVDATAAEPGISQ